MALIKKTQRSFAGGQLDKDLMGRHDLAKYSQGCLVMENFNVRKQGNVIKRAGTDLAADLSQLVEGGVGSAKLIPLVQSREEGLYVLITAKRAFLAGRSGVRMADGSWSRRPVHSEGPYSVEVPFADSDLRMLDHCQSGDTIFFAHRSYPPCKLVYSNGTLAYERISFRQSHGKQPSILSVEPGGTWGTGGTKEVEYCVTAVKDGVESPPSPAYAVSYQLPWGDGCTFRITVDLSRFAPEEYDCFYVYKKESDVFGLIGTTSKQTVFVDIRDGFSVDGDLYPPEAAGFDQEMHLRSGDGNRFASVVVTTEINENKYEYKYGARYPVGDYSRVISHWGESYNVFKPPFNNAYVAEQIKNDIGKTETIGVTGSLSSQKNSSGIIKYALSSKLNSFKISLGSMCNRIARKNITEGEYIQTSRTTYSGHADTHNPPKKKKEYWLEDYTIKSTKWLGVASEFTASAARHYTATLTFSDGTSCTVECNADVDQTKVDTAFWIPVEGETGKFRHEYADEDYMFSYSGADEVVARMDAHQPSVGAFVSFEVPDEFREKSCTGIAVSGYTDETKATPAPVLVNGIACYREGKFANTFVDDYITPDLTITPPKTEDHFIGNGEYPGSVALYQQRLVYAASAKNPFTFWMSCTGDLYNFDTHEYVRASDAITASTSALELPRINRLLVHRDLMMFADGGEWQVSASSGNALAPSTVAAKLQSVIGCAAWVKPIALDTDIIFCDRSGETLLATRYNFASDGYEASNLSVLSQRIFRNNAIRAMAHLQYPEGEIVCALEDGTLATLAYMREHDVCAWAHQVLGGGWRAFDVASAKEVASGTSTVAILARRSYTPEQAPANEGETGEGASRVSEVALLVNRDIDPNDSTLLGNLRMDGVRVVTTERGEDGKPVEPEKTPGDTAVRIGELATGHDKWAVGAAFASVLKTTSPEFTEQETAQMEIKNATEAEVRVIDGSDFSVRQADVPAERATKMKVGAKVDESGADFSVALGDADCRMVMAGTNSRNGSVVLTHDGVLPLSVLSVTTAYRIEYSNHANGGSDGRG